MQFLFFLLIIPLVRGDRIVATNNGPVKGIHIAEKKVHAFLGIPFAEPPVGSLRFEKPVPKSRWEETYNADKLPVSCIQGTLDEMAKILNFDMKMSEDCLYLNLWVPEGGKVLKPIIVNIHGGAYMIGSSNMPVVDGATLSQHGDVIVASMNYRLGTLGFFSGFIEEAAGNMGMYDQILAIQWIKDNAVHFGGDPENIVLMGESAGAFSVSLHMISPLTKDLFKRAILVGGSSFHPMYSDDNKLLSLGSQKIASMLGCADDDEDLKKNPKGVVECLRNLPAENFSKKEMEFFHSFGMLIPRVGTDFLPVSPIESFRKGDFKKIELLLGVTRDEGAVITAFRPKIFGLLGEKLNVNAVDESFVKEVLKSVLNIDFNQEIIERYFDEVKDKSRYSYLNAMVDAYGDYLITCSSVFEADYRSLNGNPVYFYLFDYRSNALPLPEWIGVSHGSDSPFVFGNPVFGSLTEYEKELSKDMMDMFVAFVKTGNPNIPGGLKWPQYTSNNPVHFVIGKSDRVGVRPDNYRCERWRNFFRSVINDDNSKET